MTTMKLTDDAKAFYLAVYHVVNQIPVGHVVSYGHIAHLVNKPQNSRQVGTSMKLISSIVPALNSELPENEWIDSSTLPWWRVVSSAGKISPRGDSNSEVRQSNLLKQEGVDVSNALFIDLDTFGWFPEEVDI
ncbi:hypothetical protein CAAN1_10S03884 [[Candida] anglica]|uniref:6-O-methylguanine-DNA methyltransferase n=1 Tax=[Candida] anglica TaxID=148631 RepID=A0ABP0EEL7_9ASCO